MRRAAIKQKRELVLFYICFSFIAVVRTPKINCFILLLFYFYFSFILVLLQLCGPLKGYSARKLLEEFPDNDWSYSALDRLLRQIDAATWSADRKSVSSRERTVCTRDMQMSVQ